MTPIRAGRAVLASFLPHLAAGAVGGAPPPDTPEAKKARLAWFHEAKVGLFVHWGLYAIPAGEWKGVEHPFVGEWIMKWAKIPAAEYETLGRRFDPEAFDPDALAQLAREAGMKYVVVTAKHHDGFAM